MRFTGHVDATISRWLMRAGKHSQGLHHALFVNLELEYLQVDELKAPIVGDRENWLWAAIEPVSKIVPTIHIGKRSNDDAMLFIHSLVLRPWRRSRLCARLYQRWHPVVLLRAHRPLRLLALA